MKKKTQMMGKWLLTAMIALTVPQVNAADFAANYSIKQWNVNLNALNLLNRKYFTTRHSAWGGIMPAATIIILAGVGYRF